MSLDESYKALEESILEKGVIIHKKVEKLIDNIKDIYHRYLS